MSDVGLQSPPPPVLSPAPAAPTSAAPADPIRKHIRGSSLLLAGRFVSVLLNFAVQVTTVRYLAKSDYGAFAYGLSVATLCATLALAGLPKAVARLVSIYHEKNDNARTFGTIAAAVTTVFALGWSFVALAFGLRGVLAGRVVTEPEALSLLLILIALTPINALDNLLQQLVAVFASPRAIFVRRHVLGPGLKLAAVLVVIVTNGSVYLLAYGYVLAGALGVTLYAAVLIRHWQKQGLLHHLNPRRLRWPLRELFSFSTPLLATEFSIIARASLAVILLEHFRATPEVAEYRAVHVVAGLNLLVFEAFAFLYTPVASRMFARHDRQAISDLYWQTAQWITVFTFPMFAVTCALSEPLTVMLFGTQYASAASLLSILAVGYYANAALGFNAATLLVHGELRFVVLGEVVATTAALGLNLLLIPRLGALGAALSTTAALLALNVVHNTCLWLGRSAVRPLDWRFMRVYLLAVAMALALLALQWLLAPPFWLGLATAAIVSVLLIRITRHDLRPDAAFPELLRIPLIRMLVS